MSRPAPAPGDPPVYTVAMLNAEARDLLAAAYGRGLAVEGEVVDLSRAASGHIYFTLADPGGEAQVRAVIWKGPALRYGNRLEKGRLVRCHGRPTVWPQRGAFQLVTERVDEAGAGLRARVRAEVHARLAAEGLFDPARKRELPAYPRCVGVVTSRSGAAVHDIIKVTGRRWPLRLVLAHATVQGPTAPAEIVAALARLVARPEVEVVIVGRGGGSSEKLDAFDDEAVVRAVAACRCPVVAAVGHEVDRSLCDLAADRSAATPSEAAELVTPDAAQVAALLFGLQDAAREALARRVQRYDATLARYAARVQLHDPRHRLAEGRARWQATTTRLEAWPAATLAGWRGRLGEVAARLDALSPLACLHRGYAVARRHEDGLVLRDAVEAPVGSRVEVVLARGRLGCRVEASTPEEVHALP